MAARLAMRTYECRNRTPCLLASRVSPLIAACNSFASVGKVMFLGCTVVSTVTRAKSLVRSAPLACATRKLSARRSSSFSPRLAPMAQVRALVRKLVLEELLSGEVLKVWVINPAFAHVFVGQAVNMLEQKKPDHKPCRNSRTTTVAVQRRDLAVDEVPVDLARELHQLVPHVDDLVQPRAKQITRFYRLVLLRPHRFPPIRRPNHASRFEGILKMKLQAFRVSDPETLQSQLDQTARKRLSVSGLEVFHGRLLTRTMRRARPSPPGPSSKRWRPG